MTSTEEKRRRRSGVEQPHVLFGPLASAVRDLSAACRPHQLWIMLDEWSALPLELQPLLADLLRRTFFAAPNVVVKIGAIQRRSRFYQSGTSGDYIGIELGADTSGSLDLDDFLLFNNNRCEVAAFFSRVLYKHLYVLMETQGFELAVKNEQEFIDLAFLSPQSFDELIWASEGVPRDAIQIAGAAANVAGEKPIATQHVHSGARDYFLRDKLGKTSNKAGALLDRLINKCVEERTRVLPLLRSGDSDNPLIQELYDLRLIHRVRQAVSLDEQDYATKYDIYLVDFGCFIDLISSGRIRTVNDGLSNSARLVTDANVKLRSQWMVNVKWSPWSGGMRGE
jgi:hypothetical protein